ncbi:MAG: 4'-phosphopantetheinyl transferase superfamily protein [Acidimicrobiales bacterium]|nr:4'-phosphopantetheinyl transferase superfamily protein [Acidimicrobiales bacterium]
MAHETGWLAAGEHEMPAASTWLAAPEQAILAGMPYTKRRSEWRLARWTAKQALARALELSPGHEVLASVEVRRNEHNAPVAYVADEPAAVSVSMTDRAGWAVCLVGPAEARLGVDLEVVEPRSELFVADWFTAAEREVVAAAEPGTPRHELANLIWSAKESALKVLQTGLRRSTHSVEVTLIDGPCAGWRPLRVRDVEDGTVFAGWWARFGTFVLTAAADRELAPPGPLDAGVPEALSVAVPVHSWMAAPRHDAGVSSPTVPPSAAPGQG